MPLAASSGIRKARALTAPSIRASFGAAADNGTDLVVAPVPNTVQVGDELVIGIASKNATVPTVSPAGAASWEHTTQAGDSSSQPFIHVFSRRVAAGDIPIGASETLNITFSFGAGTTDGITLSGVAWQDTSGFSIRPCSDFQSQTDVTNAHQHGPPALFGMGDYDGYGAFVAGLPSTATGKANVTLSTPPTGCTITANTNVQALRAAGTGGTCRGLAHIHGPTHAARVETVAYPVGQVFTTSIAYAMAPISPRKAQTQQVPPSLAGLEVYNYSNSWGSCVVFSQSDVTRGCNTYRPAPERVAAAFGAVNPHLADATPKSNNMAMGGARACDICTAAYGTFSYTSVRAGSGNAAGQTNQYNPQVVTKTALPGTIGLFTTALLGNDFLKLGTDDLTMKGGWNACDAVYRLLRAGTVKTVSDASHTYGGTWTDTSSDGYMGGAAKKTTVAGSTISIAVSGATTVNLVLIGYDDTALGVIGSAFTVKVDGVVQPTAKTITLNTAASLNGGTPTTRSFTVRDTTSNQHQNSGAYKNYKFCQVTIPVTLPDAGAHTILITPTIAGGSQFEYNGYLIPAATPPWIVSNAIWRFPNATYTSAPYSFASAQIGRDTADWFNQIVQQALAQFDRTVYYDPSAWGSWDSTATTGDGAAPAGFQGWDAAVMVSTGDGLHPSDIGCAYDAKRILQLLNERIPNPTLPFTTPTSLMPQTLPNSFTLVGTRRLTLASTFTGILECEGGGGAGGGGGVGLAGRGGGHAAYAKKNSFTLTAGCVIEITVGSGGIAAAGANGTAGTVSKVTYISGPDFPANTVLCSADFGTGGAASSGAVGTGGLAANCVGDTKISGGNGSAATGGAIGASDPLGGASGVGGAPGTAGSNYGGAGGGGNSGTQNAGGPGAQGVVKFT